jgi:hypothetical protein
MTVDHGAGPSEKGGATNINAARFLNERLRQLGVQASGLPPQVVAHLRALVEDEARRIHRQLLDDIAALQHRADERISKQVTRLVTLKTVGKAFGAATANKADSSASTATGGAAK